MKTKLNPTQNTFREPNPRAIIDLLNQQLVDVLDLGLQAKQAHWNVKGMDADTADLFTEVSRGVDKLLWLVEAHMQAKE